MFQKPPKAEGCTLDDLSKEKQDRLYRLLLERTVARGHLEPTNPDIPESVRRDLQVLQGSMPSNSLEKESVLDAVRPELEEPETRRMAPGLRLLPRKIHPWLGWGLGFALFCLVTGLSLFGNKLLSPTQKDTPKVGRYLPKTLASHRRQLYQTEFLEENLVDQGKHPNVMLVKVRLSDGRWKHCTGIVVGPYAVLTTIPCRGSLDVYRTERFVMWKHYRLPIRNDFTNPYALQLKYYRTLHLPTPPGLRDGQDGERPFAPLWFLKAQGAGRRDVVNMPAMHNLHLFFVPNLTPAFLKQHQIHPANINAFAFVKSHKAQPHVPFDIIRGVSLVGEDWQERQSLRYRLHHSTRPQGFLSIAPYEKNATYPATENVGSPLLGLASKNLYHNVLIGLLQEGQVLAPLVYPSGSARENQRLTGTVRRNHLWLLARLQDMDNDGIPALCDPDPSRPNPDKENRCPAFLGKPMGSTTQGYPKGLLLCHPGDYVAGMRARYSYYGIIHLALLCRPQRCLHHPKACKEEYWTDTYGGDPKPDRDAITVRAHSSLCQPKQTIHKIHFEMANHQIFFMEPFCSQAETRGKERSLRPFGRRTGILHIRKCPKGQQLIGVVAHNRSFKRISSMQLICSANR